MSKITAKADLNKVTDPTEFIRYASQVISDIQNVVNGNLDFGNFNAQIVSVTFQTINSNTIVNHNLNRTGVNYLLISKTAATDIYRGSGDSSGSIVLKATVATSVMLLLF